MTGRVVPVLTVPNGVAQALELVSQSVYSPTARELLAGWATLRDETREKAGRDLYDDLIGRIAAAVSLPPYSVVIRGLRFDNDNRLLVGLCAGLGTIVYADRGEETVAVDVLRPSIDLRFGALTEKLHTDSVSWRLPNWLTVQQFVTIERHGGGESLLVSADDVVDVLDNARKHDLLDFLRNTPLRWSFGSVPRSQVGCDPILAPVLEEGRIRWLRDAVGPNGDPDRDAVNQRMLAEFEDLLRDSPAVSCFLLHAGDLLVLDNHRGLHGRRPVRDPSTSRREVRRLRLTKTSENCAYRVAFRAPCGGQAAVG